MQTKWLHYHLPILLFRRYKNGKIGGYTMWWHETSLFSSFSVFPCFEEEKKKKKKKNRHAQDIEFIFTWTYQTTCTWSVCEILQWHCFPFTFGIFQHKIILMFFVCFCFGQNQDRPSISLKSDPKCRSINFLSNSLDLTLMRLVKQYEYTQTVRSYAYGLDAHMVPNIHIPWGVGCRYKQIVKDFYINTKTYCIFCFMVQASIILWLLKTFQLSTCVHWRILFLTRLFAYWSHPVNLYYIRLLFYDTVSVSLRFSHGFSTKCIGYRTICIDAHRFGLHNCINTVHTS